MPAQTATGEPGAATVDGDVVEDAYQALVSIGHKPQEARNRLDKVFAGLKAAERAGLTPIKINTVVIGGTNDDELVEFARWSRETGYEVRFIEYMPLDAEHAWERAKVVPSARILETIAGTFPLSPIGHANEPATSYGFADGAPGRIGVIASVTEPFCDTCNRLRLTAEGQVRACLFSLEETDLRGPMREGASDEELAGLIRTTVWRKWSGHRINHADFVQPAQHVDDRRLIPTPHPTHPRTRTGGGRPPPAASVFDRIATRLRSRTRSCRTLPAHPNSRRSS
jgi:molybdenum cofactor biosynthesis enzyme MoaA